MVPTNLALPVSPVLIALQDHVSSLVSEKTYMNIDAQNVLFLKKRPSKAKIL